MPQISFDGHGFSIGGRRLWVMGAAIESALLPPERWAPTLAMLRQRGINTIRTSAPWHLHETRTGRIRFDSSLDLRAFVTLCRELGLLTILRIGPSVGGTFDGGGLPAWLSEMDGLRPREPSDAFMPLVSRWYSAVLAQLKGLDATRRGDNGRGSDGAGGLLAVQIDHGWECGNTKVAARYLTELRRFVREAGVEVPVLTANGLWAGAEETFDVWQGSEDLFSHVRQLRHAQPHAPALVEVAPLGSLRLSAASRTAGSSRQATEDGGHRRHSLVTLVGQTIAAGGQAIVAHAAAEVHRHSPAGTEWNGSLLTDAVDPLLVTHEGASARTLGALAPLAMFASSFGTTIAGDTGDNAVVVDPDRPIAAAPIVVSRSSNSGTIAFVFSQPTAVAPSTRSRSKGARAAEPTRQITLVTATGMRLPVVLGSSGIAWFPIDLDLHGRARLDYAGLSPVAFINRSLLVLFGPAGARSLLSIDGGEHRVETPRAEAGAKPRILAHAGITIVICNESQAASMLLEDDGIVIGADRLDENGTVLRAAGFREAVRIDAKGRTTVVQSTSGDGVRSDATGSGASHRLAIKGWKRLDATAFAAGTSDNFASIDTPRSLAAFAARTGLGWYRLAVPASRRERLIWLPAASGALQVWLDGRPLSTLGSTDRLPLRLPASKGSAAQSLVFLAVESGRPVHGLASCVAAGISGAAWEVSSLRVKAKSVATPPFDPFERRAFVPLTPGSIPERSIQFSLATERATPIVIDPGCPFYGAVLVNGRLVDVFDLPVGAVSGITLGPGVPGWSGESIIVTLVPLREALNLERSLRAYKRVTVIEAARRGATAWAFARWKTPSHSAAGWSDAGSRASAPRSGTKTLRGVPAWHTAHVTATGTCELDLSGLTSGVVFVNGEPMGRYDAENDPRLPLPADALKGGAELVIFDASGASPTRVSIMSPPGARSS